MLVNNTNMVSSGNQELVKCVDAIMARGPV